MIKTVTGLNYGPDAVIRPVWGFTLLWASLQGKESLVYRPGSIASPGKTKAASGEFHRGQGGVSGQRLPRRLEDGRADLWSAPKETARRMAAIAFLIAWAMLYGLVLIRRRAPIMMPGLITVLSNKPIQYWSP